MIDLHLLHRLVFRRALALTFLSCLSFWTIAAEAIKVIRTDFVAPIELAIGVDNPSILSEWINPTSDLQKVASANQLEREFNKANREAFYKARSFFDLGKARMTNRADSAASNKWVRARAAAKEATRTAEEARVKFETAKAVAYPPPKELSLLIDHYPVEFVKPVRFDYGAKKI